jgi:ubiquinone/menaquinone biosynthesis C-methylase UbiE
VSAGAGAPENGGAGAPENGGAGAAAGFLAGDVAESYRHHLEAVIFAPWAERLLEFAHLRPGERVLDVASGTGAVARAAAAVVGPAGTVIATDVSAQMLAHVAGRSASGSAAIETIVAPATELPIEDDSVDLVTCQQGLQFVPDAVAAVREMRRVLRPGGRAVAAVWLRPARNEPFATFAEVLESTGIAEPFPGAFAPSSRARTLDEVRELFESGGLEQVEVSAVRLVATWDSAAAAAEAIAGTPLGPAFTDLDPVVQTRVLARLAEAFAGPDGVARTEQSAVFALGVA